MTPRSQNRNLDDTTVPHEADSSGSDPVILSVPFGDDQGLSYHPSRLAKSPWTPVVCAPVASSTARWTAMVVRSLVCATTFACAGCGLGQTGPQKYTEEEKKAQLDQLLAAYPAKPTDAPEQSREKEAEVEEKLPRVNALLEEVKTDPAKVNEVVELSMSLVSLVPEHRAANVAYCQAQLASFHAKEVNDPYQALVAINSAAREIERFREIFDDLSDDERQLFQDVYFNQARREGYFPDGEDAPDSFKKAIENLMNLGFRDAERLKTEPKFESFFTDPKFAPVLEAALAQIEGSAPDNQTK